ncbi:IS3 family transposase [Micromonospora peucetia]|uniref:IS3 family transposase n=1 Tax=Micromonospora peucetia TaxID=47871 RepID=UPI003F610503
MTDNSVCNRERSPAWRSATVLRPRGSDRSGPSGFGHSPERKRTANAIFEYLEIFHNRQRRHSSLGVLSPIEYERARPMSLSVA